MLFFGRRKVERRSNVTILGGTDRRSCTDRRSNIPRRKHERYKAKDDVFVRTKGSVVKIGKFLDVSKGGLSFHYVDVGSRPKNSFDLDIIVRNNGFHLENLSLRTITDLEAKNKFAFSITPMRRLGGQFGLVSQTQISQIEYLIKHHTSGIV